MPPPKRRDEEGPAAWLRYSGIAGTLIGTIGVCLGLGLWADSAWGTSPWLTIVGSLVGVVGGLYVSLKDLL